MRLVDAVERGRLTGWLAATTFTTLAYYLERAFDVDRAREDLSQLIDLFHIASVSRETLRAALHLSWHDIEDAVLHEAARQVDAEGIVTRNGGDFSGAAITIYSPPELLALLGGRSPAS